MLGEISAFGGINVEPSVRSCFEKAGDTGFIEVAIFFNFSGFIEVGLFSTFVTRAIIMTTAMIMMLLLLKMMIVINHEDDDQINDKNADYIIIIKC